MIEESLRLKLTHTDGRICPDDEDYTKKMPKNPSLLEEPPPKSHSLHRKLSDNVRESNVITSQIYSALVDEGEGAEEVPIWKNCTDDYVLAVSGGAFN